MVQILLALILEAERVQNIRLMADITCILRRANCHEFLCTCNWLFFSLSEKYPTFGKAMCTNGEIISRTFVAILMKY